MSAVCSDDDQVHHNQHQVVVPAVRAVLAPEAGLPDEDLLLHGAEHHQNQSGSSQLSKYAEDHAQSAGKLGCAQKHGEALAHADALSALRWVCKVAPAARNEDGPHHQAEEEQGGICKSSEVEHSASP